jgi:K+-transporting ATPase ATPase A chain
VLRLGPVAAWEAIKFIGCNGGGFYAASSAHPFENPNELSNLSQMWAMALLPCAIIFMYGNVIERNKHATALFVFLWVLVAIAAYFIYYFEYFHGLSPNMAGKELRFGILGSATYTSLSAVSAGTSNSYLPLYAPQSILVILINLLIGSAVMGGIGSGFFNLLIFILLAVYFTGVMAGKTPKFLGKRIGANEIKYMLVYLIIYQSMILIQTTANIAMNPDYQSYHGFTELLFLYSANTLNNGLSFITLAIDYPFIYLVLSIAMVVGKVSLTVVVFLIASEFALKRKVDDKLDDIELHSPFFIFMVLFVMLNDLLVFMPSLIIGPIMEIWMK